MWPGYCTQHMAIQDMKEHEAENETEDANENSTAAETES